MPEPTPPPESVVRFLRVIPGHYRQGKGYTKGEVMVSVLGHLVQWREARGWSCSCTDVRNPAKPCQHLDLVQSVVDTSTLEQRKDNRP